MRSLTMEKVFPPTMKIAIEPLIIAILSVPAKKETGACSSPFWRIEYDNTI